MKNVNGSRNSAISVFSKIARENYQQLLALESQQQAANKMLVKSMPDDKEQLEFDLMRLQDEATQCAVIAIVFSAIAVESYIYDYASRNLSDAFVQNYLDKLDPVSKWVIIPRLVTGKDLPREHRWFELLKQLIQQRNTIIHHKSSSPPREFGEMSTYYKKLFRNANRIYKTAGESIELFDLLLAEMKELDPAETAWIDVYFASHSDTTKFLEDL